MALCDVDLCSTGSFILDKQQEIYESLVFDGVLLERLMSRRASPEDSSLITRFYLLFS
jgi:hypothetical protein